jgi:hypothetical protein
MHPIGPMSVIIKEGFPGREVPEPLTTQRKPRLVSDPRDVENLYKLTAQIRLMTEAIDRGEISSEAMFTSADLSRLFGIDRDIVKKHLRFLKNIGLIRPVGFSPKRYRFDHFYYRQFLKSSPTDQNTQEFLERLQANPIESDDVTADL